ncbi:uncharacterized protein LOC124606562 [Schistocerca americana]|uniref:uncharacterized protein LOC124606562 n=1 Tax=Schistocerca americana TaxID=7009 RepID=UPI001F4FF26B|nr:uncharacterized protein LOC124606562 [Schistocerca americana]
MHLVCLQIGCQLTTSVSNARRIRVCGVKIRTRRTASRDATHARPGAGDLAAAPNRAWRSGAALRVARRPQSAAEVGCGGRCAPVFRAATLCSDPFRTVLVSSFPPCRGGQCSGQCGGGGERPGPEAEARSRAGSGHNHSCVRSRTAGVCSGEASSRRLKVGYRRDNYQRTSCLWPMLRDQINSGTTERDFRQT